MGDTKNRALQIIHGYKQEILTMNATFKQQQSKVATLGYAPGLRKLLINRSIMIDRCLKKLWRHYNLEQEKSIALFAVGGYGRREVFPASDIDLLILLTSPLNNNQQLQIEDFVQSLWDLGTTIGQSVRSLDECLALAKQDHTILTSLLNCRKIIGSSDQFSIKLRASLETNSVSSSELFYQQKKQEYQKRHLKHADTEYNLEPNIKEAPGGLRDVHTLLWISKYTLGMGSLTKLVRRNILSKEEQAQLQKSYDFIASVRYCIHIMVGRDENRLLFDYQKKMASELGFYGDTKNQAVEQFMKAYYRHASSLAALVDLLLENVEEEILSMTIPHDTPINHRFTLIGSKIAIRHDHVFQKTPSAILEIFYLLGQSPRELGIRANTIRRLRDARHKIDARFRKKPENTALFLLILQSPYRLFTQLQRMKRYGILGRYLPEFGHVIGQMQYDLFHVYTVDAHALLVIQNMRLLRHTEARQTFPIASKIIHGLANRMLLYIAGIFHDMAKGRGGDHSILGAQDVEKFCKRHRLSQDDTELVTWLVLEHLMMSMTAQKMDISDYRVIEAFAKKVGDHERLDYLYLLTICDIGATNPKLLNPWRLSLINQLYLETSYTFKRSLEPSEHWAGWAARKRSKAKKLLREKGIHEHMFRDLWQSFGDPYFSKYSAEDICWHTEAIMQHNTPSMPLVIVGLTQESSTQVYTQIFIYMRDCELFFVNSVAVLGQLGLNILDARVLTSKSGYTLNTYIVDDNNTGIISNTPQIYSKICKAMQDQLVHPSTLPDSMHSTMPRTHKHFSIENRIQIQSLLDTPFTLISLETLDRPGLLTRIGRIFAQHHISVHAAKILTFGEKAEDYFYISHQQKPLTCPILTASLYEDLVTAIT